MKVLFQAKLSGGRLDCKARVQKATRKYVKMKLETGGPDCQVKNWEASCGGCLESLADGGLS